MGNGAGSQKHVMDGTSPDRVFQVFLRRRFLDSLHKPVYSFANSRPSCSRARRIFPIVFTVSISFAALCHYRAMH